MDLADPQFQFHVLQISINHLIHRISVEGLPNHPDGLDGLTGPGDD